MYCGKCGAEMKDSDTFCPKCGNKVGKSNGFGNITIRKPVFSKGFKMACAVVFGCFALGMVGLIISNIVRGSGKDASPQTVVASTPNEAPTETPVPEETTTPEPTPTATPTLEPTATPEPTPTEEPKPTPTPKPKGPVFKVSGSFPRTIYTDGFSGSVGVKISKLKVEVENTGMQYAVHVIAKKMEVIEKSANVMFIFNYKVTDSKGNVLLNKKGGFLNVDEGDVYKDVEIQDMYFYYDDLPPGKYKVKIDSVSMF